MSPRARLSVALPFLLLMTACGMQAAEEARPAKSPAQEMTRAQPRPEPAAASRARAPEPRRQSRSPEPPPSIIAARLPISRPEVPPTRSIVVQLPLPSDPVGVPPKASYSPRETDAPRVTNLRLAPDPPAAPTAFACDCTSLTCPTPVEACLFMVAPDPNIPDGLLDPRLAGAA